MLIAYFTWLAGLYILQDRMLFPSQLAQPGTGEPAGAEVWWLTTAEGHRVEAWYWPAPGPGPAPAVIFCHGNAELIDNGLGQADLYRSLGWAVLLPEYRGYGRSGGKPGQRAITADLVAFRDRLARQSGVDPARIVYHGRSVGGGLAAALAVKRAPAALVLESTFTSVTSFAWSYGVPPILCRNPLRTDTALAGFAGPVLILHGEDDEIVPAAHARRLASIARSGTLRFGPGGHNDYPRDWTAYERAISESLATSVPEP